MDSGETLLEKLISYGIGRRKLDDKLFINDKPLRLGVFDLDEENLCHEIIKTNCHIPGCNFIGDTLLDFENHYNTSHRYTCNECKQIHTSPHLLDLHVQEMHDSFFAVMSERKPSYCCYVEECKIKFKTPDERWKHGLEVHKLPKDFRFEQQSKRKKNPKRVKNVAPNNKSMEVDETGSDKAINFWNCKQKTFPKYTGKKFTDTAKRACKDVDMQGVVADLKENLPQ